MSQKESNMEEIFKLMEESYFLSPRSSARRQIVNVIRTRSTKVISKENVGNFLKELLSMKLNSDCHVFLYNLELLFSFPNILHESANDWEIMLILDELIANAYLTLEQFSVDNVSQSNEACSRLLRMEQLLCRVLQHVKTEFVICNDKSLIHKILSLLMKIVTEIPLLDCKKSAGIIATLLLRHGRQDFECSLQEIVYLSRNCTTCPDELANFDSLQLFILSQITRSVTFPFCAVNQLSFLLGLLSVLTPNNLLTRNNKTLPSVSMALFERIICDIGVNESSARLLVVQLLLQWHQKVLESQKAMNEKLDVYSEILSPREKFVDYVFIHQDDPVDAIKHSARSVFHLMIKNHHTICQCSISCDVLQDILTRVNHLSWDNRAKYSLLSHLADVFGPNSITNNFTNLQFMLLQCCTENSLAHHASDLYMKLMSLESNCKSQSLDPAQHGVSPELWLDVILDSYRDGDDGIRLGIIQHFVLKMSKTFPAGLYYLIQKCQQDGCHSMGLLMACLKGILKRNVKLPMKECETGDSMWRSIVSYRVLRRAFICEDEEIRLNALSLLTEDAKITKLVPIKDLELVLDYMKVNLRYLSPYFRQKFTSLIKNFLTRINESILSWSKKNVSESVTILGDYQLFYENVFDQLMNCLYPGCSFPARCTALSLLSVTTSSYSSHHLPSDWKPLSMIFTPDRDRKLLACFTDSFQENKILAFQILKTTKAVHRIDTSHLTSLADKAWSLCRGNRPQDCSVANILLDFLIGLPSDTFSSLFKDTVQTRIEMESDYEDLLKNEVLLINLLVESLENEIRMGETNLISVAVTHPFYSIISSLHNLLNPLSLRCIEAMCPALTLRIVRCCYAVAKIVSPIVTHSSPEGFNPVEFPEGLLGPGLDVSALLTGASSISSSSMVDGILPVISETVENPLSLEFVPEALVLCCWRSIKESSLLLGELASLGLLESHKNCPELKIFHYEDVEEMGLFFWSQLLESRHRGAFEIASTGFSMLCKALWSSSDSRMQNLPKLWLEKVISAIKRDDESDVNLCVTRRSGGLPYYLLSLIVSEKNSGRPSLYSLPKVMSSLMDLVSDSAITNSVLAEDEEKLTHALNISRMLYQNATLAEDMAPYVADGLRASILGFGSSLWAVRNSSTLLFSAMIQRIFGVNRTKELTSKKNCISSRIFFNRYNTLYNFLLSQLESEIINIGSPRPKLYAILLLFSRLLPPTMEGTDSVYRLDVFVPLIQSCGYSPIIRVRNLASRALISVIPNCNMGGFIINLLHDLPNFVCDLKMTSFNTLHGKLLQIRYLIEDISNNNDLMIAENITTSQLLAPILKRTWLFNSTEQMPCFAVACECIKILFTLLTIDRKLHSYQTNAKQWRTILDCVMANIVIKKSGILHDPFSSEYVEAQCQLILELKLQIVVEVPDAVEELLKELSQSSVVEVRRILLKYLRESGNGFEHLVTHCLDDSHGVLLAEWDHECLAEMLRLYLTRSISPSETIVDAVLSKMKRIKHIVFQSVGVEFLSFGVSALSHQGRLSSEKCRLIIDYLISCFREVWNYDKALELRVAVVSSLKYLAYFMLHPDNPLGGNVFVLWEIWFSSLMTDVPQIALAGVQLFKSFSNEEYDDLNSLAVLADAMKIFLNSFEKATCCLYWRQILNWTLLGLSIEEKHDDRKSSNVLRIFSQEEFNLSKDDVYFIETLIQAVNDMFNVNQLGLCCLSIINENRVFIPLTNSEVNNCLSIDISRMQIGSFYKEKLLKS